MKIRTTRLKLKKLVWGAVALLAVTTITMPAQVFAVNNMPISYHEWNGDDFLRGEFDQARLTHRLGQPALTLTHGAQTGSWTSPEYKLEAPSNKIVASWQAQTPGYSRIETHLQVQRTDGTWSNWYNMGNWAFANTVHPDGSITSQRGFAGEQADATGSVDQDTYWTNDNIWVKAYKLRSIMHADNGKKPVVRQLAAVASDYLQNTITGTSPTTMKRTIELPVPALSQYVHGDPERGVPSEYPQFDGGGAAWCSPTSTTMVLRYWGKGPSRRDIQRLPADPVFDANNRVDGDVDYAAHHIFDNGFPDKNTGNWPLNTAYAASFGLDTSVRQYNSLQDLERWIKKGVPLVITLKWDNTNPDPVNHLTGSSIEKTAGHLMVIRGFTETGNVIANDPASPEGNEQVRHVYDRGQIERLWLKAKGGTVYVIKPY